MLNKKPEDPTDILVWKLSLPIMDNNSVTKLIQRSINKNMIKQENYITPTFVRNHIVGKTAFGNVL